MTDDSYSEFSKGMLALDAQNYEQALAHFRRSMELEPHYKTCQRLAQILTEMGKEAEAENYVEQAYLLNPAHSQAATDYAALLIKRNNDVEAAAILRQVLTANPTYSPARKLLSDLA